MLMLQLDVPLEVYLILKHSTCVSIISAHYKNAFFLLTRKNIIFLISDLIFLKSDEWLMQGCKDKIPQTQISFHK